MDLILLSKILGSRLWVLIGIGVGVFIVVILCVLSVWVMFRRKSKRSLDKYSLSQIPHVSKDIIVDMVGVQISHDQSESVAIPVHDKPSENNSNKLFSHLHKSKSGDADNISQCSSVYHHEKGFLGKKEEEEKIGIVT